MENYIRNWIQDKQTLGQWASSTAEQALYWGLAFIQYLGVSKLCQITSELLDNYRRSLRKHSIYTRQNRERFAKSFFQWCVEKNLILVSPAAHWKSSKIKQQIDRYLEVKEIKQILSSINTETPRGIQVRAIIELLYATAIRRNELIQLNVSDLDIVKRSLYIHLGKGNKSRQLPVISSTTRYMEHYLKQARPQLVKDNSITALFLGPNKQRITEHYMEFIMKKLKQTTDIRISCHMLRHSAATHLMQQGVDLIYIQKLLGHSEIATTQRYLRITDTELAEIYYQSHPINTWE